MTPLNRKTSPLSRLAAPRLRWWVAAGAVAGVLAAAAGLRRRLAGATSPTTGPRNGHAPAPREHWSCECGQAFVVTGRDRHRIYWMAGADEGDPVLDHRCPNCGRALPAETPAGLAAPR
jgi:hypothetical protein